LSKVDRRLSDDLVHKIVAQASVYLAQRIHGDEE
jgi:hypothetical protein